MKLAVSTLGCPSLTWQETVRMAKDIGLDGIELWGHKTIPVAEVQKAIGQLRTGYLEISCISCRSLLQSRESSMDAMEEARVNIALAEQLGAKFVRVLSNCSMRSMRARLLISSHFWRTSLLRTSPSASHKIYCVFLF